MASRSRAARRAIAVALLSVVGLAAWYGPAVWADSGSFAVVLFGVPLACTVCALWVECTGGTAPAAAVLSALAGVSLVWSLLTALGVGLLFLVPSLLLVVAAAASWTRRTGPGPPPSVQA